MDKPWLYRGTVTHNRLLPRTHRFSYPAFFICFPLNEKEKLRSRFFSLNRFNLFSYHEADHGDGRDGESWARQILQQEGINGASGSIELLTLPRMLGFVFNPVSFWFCHDQQEALKAIICEVKNTFGERHYYLLIAENGLPINEHTPLRARKVFHVSPFFEVKGDYHFRFTQKKSLRSASIDYLEDGQLVLKTAITGKALTLNDHNLLKLFFSLGWFTVMVVVRIHWQALKIWLKGMTFHRKPSTPIKEISR
ncbi:MAG: DUF1365 domain-containing protein [bacterium]|nr:DUF1365 domain-containing protein [bacterium]